MSDEKVSRRPSHQTVVAYLALAVVLLTGTAYAAATIDSGDVINSSLKSVDLKNNAGVKGADVPANNLTGADFNRGASASVGGADVRDNALGTAQVNEGSLAASRIVATLGGGVGQPVPTAGPVLVAFLNNTYTQAPTEHNEFFGGGQVTFSAACTQPRSVIVYALMDSPVVATDTILGFATVTDAGAGAATRRLNFVPFVGAGSGMAQTPTGAATARTVFLQADANCSAGAGVTLDSTAFDVVGHR